MKKSLLYQAVTVFLAVAFTGLLYAQPRMTTETRFIIQTVEQEFKQTAGNSAKWNWMMNQYPLQVMNGRYTLAFVAKKNDHYASQNLIDANMIPGSIIGNIMTIRVPVESLSNIFTVPGIQYIEVAGKIHPDLDKSVFCTRVDSIHKGINLPAIYNGTDVIIGITDWGFDYSHPMFYDTLLNQTRIIAAWDQAKTTGPGPLAYSYGTEYVGEAALLSAVCDTAGFYGRHYHGTHVAGIAGGSNGGTIFRGMAYQSEFLFASLSGDIASAIDAFSWFKNIADAAGKRLVTNQSWGAYHWGTMDGNSLLSEAMNTLVDQNVVMCNSAGNNGNDNFHIYRAFYADTLMSQLQFYSYSDTSIWGENVIMWGDTGHAYSISYRFLNTSNVIIGQTPFFNTSVDTNYIDSNYVIGTDTIFYKFSAGNSHPLNARPYMQFKVKCTAPYKVILVAYADSGSAHFWNLAERINGTTNWGRAFLSLGSGYTAGNNANGVGEPGVTENLITVASHNPDYRNGSGNIILGAISTFSSYGPTIDNRRKPDISAPGGNIASSMNHCTDYPFTLLTTSNFNSINYPFAKLSGTSMSSPATAGVAAILLDAMPSLTSQDVKDIIKQTAREDIQTGNIGPNGSTRWGWGKLNAYLALATAMNILGADEWKNNGVILFPNPTVNEIFISSVDLDDSFTSYSIYSMDGKLVKTGSYVLNQPILVSDLANGLYSITISSVQRNVHSRFVKQ